FQQPVLALPLHTPLVPGADPGTAWATVDGITREIADGDLTGPVIHLPAGTVLVGAVRAGLVVSSADGGDDAAVGIVPIGTGGAAALQPVTTGRFVAAASDAVAVADPNTVRVYRILPSGAPAPGEPTVLTAPADRAAAGSAALSPDGNT